MIVMRTAQYKIDDYCLKYEGFCLHGTSKRTKATSVDGDAPNYLDVGYVMHV